METSQRYNPTCSHIQKGVTSLSFKAGEGIMVALKSKCIAMQERRAALRER